jgi:hypothetical protein
MGVDTLSGKRDELHELIGALSILTLLREEMEQWLEEAQDPSEQETLENVVGHLAAMEEEYRRRRRMIGGEYPE